MEMQNLKVSVRDNGGTSSARRLRLTGVVPAVLYGGDGKPVPLAINYRTLEQLLHSGHGEHAIVQLEVENEPGLNTPVMIKDVQHHPVRGDVVHADFQRIRLDQKIRTLVAVKTEGQAEGVIEGGILDLQCRELEVECFALDVPENIGVDVTALMIGQSLHVRDLEAPDNVTILTNPERTLVAVHAPRVVEEVVEAIVEEGEGEEAEAEGEGEGKGETAEGETPESGEKKSKG